jgi:hypothetical protein
MLGLYAPEDIPQALTFIACFFDCGRYTSRWMDNVTRHEQGGRMFTLRMIRADLSPVFQNHRGESLDEATIVDWEGAVMFDGNDEEDFDKMEELAGETISVWADVTEWTTQIICKGLYRLTPRDWSTKPVKHDRECRSCRMGSHSKCVC